MADFTNAREDLVFWSRPNWGAIWAGMFSFIAIWAVFGTLGMAIFASAANPNAAKPVTGMGVGMAIWSIILTIIAMFVGGSITGRLAGKLSKSDGVVHGIIMFGLSVASVLVLMVIGGNGAGSTSVGMSVRSPYVLGVFSGASWAGFIALLLGWFAAMAGASSGQGNIPRSEEQPVRRAA